MTEALRIAPGTLDSKTLQAIPPSIFEIPPHLTRKRLQEKQRISGNENQELQKLWYERGEKVEKKVQSIIASQTEIVKSVNGNPAPDTEGYDLTVEFIDGFVIDRVFIEVKSSTIGIRSYKKQIRDSLPEGQRDMEHVRKWMTENNIILINGGEKDNKEKTPEEILSDSFNPQLQRILNKRLADSLNKYHLNLRSKEPTQLFPEPKRLEDKAFAF
jgi:hypothetical protein